jgi:hypothetical protein
MTGQDNVSMFTIPLIQRDSAGSSPIPSFSEAERESTALWSALTSGQVTPVLRQAQIPSPLLSPPCDESGRETNVESVH